jgi:hypothetical protein
VYRDIRYVVDLRHPLQALCGGDYSVEATREDIYPVVKAVGMWEAGFMAFHAFQTLSFRWPALRAANAVLKGDSVPEIDKGGS